MGSAGTLNGCSRLRFYNAFMSYCANSDFSATCRYRPSTILIGLLTWAGASMLDDRDHEFATIVLNASLTLMSILVAVITFLAVEYKGVQADPPLADPLWKAVMGTTVASVFAGVISLAALIYLRSGLGKTAILTWAFGILIAIMTGGIVYLVRELMA
jgi:hypothetical protein